MTEITRPEVSLMSPEFAAETGKSLSDDGWVFGRWSEQRGRLYFMLTLCIAGLLVPIAQVAFFLGNDSADFYQEWSSVRSVTSSQAASVPLPVK